MARDLGYPGEGIVYNSPFNTVNELERAQTEGALVNLNDETELEQMIGIAGGSERRPVGIRISSNRLGLRRRTRFGFSLDDGRAEAAVRTIRDSSKLVLVGLHMHLLGDTDDS